MTNATILNGHAAPATVNRVREVAGFAEAHQRYKEARSAALASSGSADDPPEFDQAEAAFERLLATPAVVPADVAEKLDALLAEFEGSVLPHDRVRAIARELRAIARELRALAMDRGQLAAAVGSEASCPVAAIARRHAQTSNACDVAELRGYKASELDRALWDDVARLMWGQTAALSDLASALPTSSAEGAYFQIGLIDELLDRLREGEAVQGRLQAIIESVQGWMVSAGLVDIAQAYSTGRRPFLHAMVAAAREESARSPASSTA